MPLYMLKEDKKGKDWSTIMVAQPNQYIIVDEDAHAEMTRRYLLRCGIPDSYSDVLLSKEKIPLSKLGEITPYDSESIIRIARLSDETPYDLVLKNSTGKEVTLKLVHLTTLDFDEDYLYDN